MAGFIAVETEEKKMSKVSFIIPVYNCEKYLRDCINCIVNAKLAKYEIILVDDGSKDNSAAICDMLEKENQNIKCIHQKNQGVSVARNNGIKVATGELIIFVDADDSIDSRYLNKVITVMEANPKIDMALWGISFDYYHKGKCYRQDQLAYPIDGVLEPAQWCEDLVGLYSVNALSPIWNKVYRSKILKEYQVKFNEKMFLYEDLEFSIRYLAKCNAIYNTTDCIYHYRQTEDEGNAGRRLKRIPHLSKLVEQIEDALDCLIANKQLKNEHIKGVLIKLYLGIAHEKIAVSSLHETKVICEDFIEWKKEHSIEVSEQDYKAYKNIMEKKIVLLQAKRLYIKIRHAVAVKVKNIKIYQKRRGRTST